MEDVAALAGVSRALVSLVMRSSPKVSPARRERVLQAAEELGYRPNAMARNLARRRTHSVGVLLHDLHNPFFGEIAEGLSEVAVIAGYRVLLTAGGVRARGEAEALESLLEYRTDAIVLLSPALPSAAVVAASEACPVVVVGRAIRSSQVDCVVTDDSLGGSLATEHLISLGHTDIAHIDGGFQPGSAPRRRAYIAAMTKAGLAGHCQVRTSRFAEQDGWDATEDLLAAACPPSAIFAGNDLVAAGAMAYLNSIGMEVPGDLSVVGYDNTYLAGMHHLSLTTVSQPRAEMGRLAMTVALERIGDQRQEPVLHTLAPALVVRATTGPPPRCQTRKLTDE
jgi:DNA-binding LacI/PurR family transcriptional regulator